MPGVCSRLGRLGASCSPTANCRPARPGPSCVRGVLCVIQGAQGTEDLCSQKPLPAFSVFRALGAPPPPRPRPLLLPQPFATARQLGMRSSILSLQGVEKGWAGLSLQGTRGTQG